MEIKSLHKDVISSIRSTISINKVSQCIMELVLNSLDAKSTAIAVRLNMSKFRIQVVDNGKGISRKNLEAIGTRYMTNKCYTLSDLQKKSHYYGYRGEALSSIFKISKTVNITTREKGAKDTYNKQIHEGKLVEIVEVKKRPSNGSTITIENLFYNVPVRQKSLKENTEFAEIKRLLEAIIVLRPNVSFTLRNDLTGDLILACEKKADIKQSLIGLYPDIIDDENLQLLEVSKGPKIQITALFYRKLYHSNNAQFIYVNKRPVSLPTVQKMLNKLFLKHIEPSKKKLATIFNKNRHPVYVLNIKCPYSEVDFLNKSSVQFKNLTAVKTCVEKIVYHFFNIEKNEIVQVKKKRREGPDVGHKTNCGVSEIYGVVKAYGCKRKCLPEPEGSQNSHQEKRRKVDEIQIMEPSQSESLKDFEIQAIEATSNVKSDDNNNNNNNFSDSNFTQFNNKVGKEKSVISETLVTNLTDTEQNGKALIMDIFLKSVKLYKNSSFNADDMNESDKKELTKSEFAYSILPSKKRRAEKLNQVIFSGTPAVANPPQDMTSKCVQTTMICEENHPKINEDFEYFYDYDEESSINVDNITFKVPENMLNMNNQNVFNFETSAFKNFAPPQRKTMQRYVSDYNYNFSNLEEVPFTFNFKNNNNNVHFNDYEVPTKLFDCNYYNFQNQPNFNVTTLENVQLSPIPFDKSIKGKRLITKTPLEENYETFKRNDFNRLQKIVMTPQKPNYKNYRHDSMNCSKFFTDDYLNKKFNVQKSPFKPEQSSRFFNNFKIVNDTFAINKPNFNKNVPFFTPNTTWKSNYEQIDEIIDLISTTSEKENEEENLVQQPLTVESSNFLVTLSERQRNKLIEKHLQTEMDINQKMAFTPTQTQKSPEFFSQPLFNDWMKSVDHFGNRFYFNKRTGICTFKSPKQGEQFQMKTRFEFVPKGMSPILTETKPVDQSLSMTVKEKLQQAVIESYENQLVTVKWELYLKDNCTADFFTEMYKEKAKEFNGPEIPCLKNTGAVTLDKNLFKSVKVIGQVDQKFIVVLEETCNNLLVFDQHAVHERIRLEQLQQDYRGTSVKLDNQVTIFMQQIELNYLINCANYLNGLGLFFETLSNCIVITEIPTCLYNKIEKEIKKNDTYLNDLVELLVNDCLEIIKSTRGVPVSFPDILKNVINFEACRGAIKFGDKLSLEECSDLLKSLVNCNLPFQCAHGRPTVIPLVKLQETPVIVNKVNFKLSKNKV